MVVHARYPIGEPRVQRQALAAVEAGYHVDVVCLRHVGEPAHETVEGVDVHRLPVSHDRTAGAAGMAVEYLAFFALAAVKVARLSWRERYDVLHVSNPPDLLVFTGLLPRLRGAHLILDVHDLTPDLFEWRFGDVLGRRFVRRALEWQERLSVRAADSVMTVHDGCAAALEERSTRGGQPIAIVMNALDERLLPERLPERSGWHDPVSLVYHGSLTQLYGVHILIDALAKTDVAGRAVLDVLGDGDDRPRLERQAAELGLSGSVRFSRGFVPIRAALEAVAECDIGVVPFDDLPINRFSLPSKLFEYVVLGLPVVCARTDTIARHFAEDELFFFRPGDPDDLAQRLRDVLADPVGAQEQARRARERYEDYRWERSKARFLELIKAPRTRGTRGRG